MKRLLLGFLTFVSFQITNAQHKAFQVQDAETGAALPFVTVSYGPGRGVITNEEGYFRLPEDPGSASITLSCLGYASTTLSLPLEKQQIKMVPEAVQLDEVLLQDRYPTAGEIMARVRKALPDNHNTTGWEHDFFSRSTSAMDFESLDFEVDKASVVSREVIKASNRELDSLAARITAQKTLQYHELLGKVQQENADSISCMIIDKATELVDTRRNFKPEEIESKVKHLMLQYLDTTTSYKVKTGLFTIEKDMTLDEFEEEEEPEAPTIKIKSAKDQFQEDLANLGLGEGSWLVGLTNPDNYAYELTGVSSWNGRNVYRLRFTPDRGRAKYTGEFLVDMLDYGVHYVSFKYAKGKRGSKFNLKLLLGLKFVENRKEGIALYRRQEDEGYLPQYYSFEEGFYVYVRRPFKFINNSRKREKVKFEFLLSGNASEREEILISQSRKKQSAEGACELEKEIPIVRRSSFDASLWESAEVVQPLQEMREYGLQ